MYINKNWRTFSTKSLVVAEIILIVVLYSQLQFVVIFRFVCVFIIPSNFFERNHDSTDKCTHCWLKVLYIGPRDHIKHSPMWAWNRTQCFSPSLNWNGVCVCVCMRFKCEKLKRWLLHNSWRVFPRLLWHVCSFYWSI